jgi:hypothetical protein
MKKQDFINLCADHYFLTDPLHGRIRVCYVETTWPYKYLESAKGVTAKFDFKCDFKDGVCIRRRKNPLWQQDDLKNERKMCCCINCVHHIGYLSLIREDDIAMYARKFNKYTGFWRDGIGCNLPREKRSITCVGYACNLEYNSEDDVQLSGLIYCMRTLQDNIKEDAKLISSLKKEK